MKILKNLFIIIMLLISPQVIKSQNWTWSNHLICSGDVQPLALISDNSNNVYIAGTYSDQTLQVGSDTIHNFGNTDGFLCKFNPQGDLQWLRRIGGTNTDEIEALVIIGNSLYVTGSFRSSVLYFTATGLLLNSNGWDGFLAVYDLDGAFQQATRIFWGQSNERIRDMVYDQDRSQLVFTGSLKTQLIYDNGTVFDTITSTSAKDIFVAQSNLAGKVSNIATFEALNTGTRIKNINSCQNTGYFITGDIKGKILFTPTDSLEGEDVNMDILCFKVDTGLTFDWGRKAGGPLWDHGNSSASDIYGNIYIDGQIEDDVYFDATATETVFIPEVGNEDIYIAKYNKLGTLQWVRRKGDAGKDDGYGLTQRENLVQFCGNFSGTVIFNIDTLRSSSTSDRNTGFAIFNPDGEEVGAQGVGGTLEDRGVNIVFTPSGNTVIAGYFLSPDFTIGDSVFTNASATQQGFIGEYYYPFIAVVSQTVDISCSGGNNGELLAIPYFGIGPYAYEWSPNVTSFDGARAYDLSAGLYSVTITDSRDSVASKSFQLDEPLPISITLDSTNLTCYESGDGAIDITVTGGTVAGDYKYNWTGGTGLNPSGSDQSNLFAGVYNVTVTDDNNCVEYASTTITQPDPIAFAGSMVTPSIPSGSCSGSIDVEVQGGTPGYSYDWTKGGVPMPGRTSDTLNNLCGDTYIVTVTDNNLCVSDTSFVVGDEDQLIVFIDTLVHVTCNGYNNGYARVGISGDKGIDFSYTWEDSEGAPAGADTNYIDNKPGGIYYLTVTENGGDHRIDSLSITIQEPLLLTTSLVSTDPLCYGDVNGIINLSVSGGKPLYTYNWSTGQTTEDLINVPGSTAYYKVTVTDKNGCQAVDSALLEDPEELVVSISVMQGLLCHGSINATLRANVSGGTGSLDYLWNDPGHQTSQFATGLDAGNYEVTVTDDNGCQNTDSYELIEPEPITIASVDSTHVSCKGASDGSILITPAGGTAPYTFTWDRIPVDTNYVSGLSAAFGGEYSVIVSDINECPPASFSMQIKEPDVELNITENAGSHVDNECYGGSTGELAVSAAGGWGNYEFSLAGTDWGTTTNYNGLASGNYYIRVRDSGECYDSVMVTISQPSEISIIEVAASHINAQCYGDNTGQLEVQASGGTPDYEYSIDNANWSTNPLFESLYADSHIIWVRDANECIDSATFLLTEPEQLVIEVTVSGDTINAAATGGTAPLFYSLNSGSLQVSGLFTGLSEGDYLVMVIDGHSCSTDTTVTVGEVEPPPPDTLITIYDAFSPNADGKNDVWNIGNIQDYPDCVVKIFNTWGTAVFSSNGYEEPWDGKHNGKELPSGTYYYYIDLGDDNGIYTGTVNIVK
jgi:gliding motility-associated-like protein